MKSHPPAAQVYAPEQHQAGYQPSYNPPPDYHHSHSYPSGTSHPPSGHHVTYAPVTHQPMNQATNIVVNTGGGSGSGRQRQWSTKICGCCEDIGSCVFALFCTPCSMIQLATKSDECCCLPFCVPEALMALRIKIRAKEGIEGSICRDCVCSACCPLLVLCQLHREIDNIGRNKPGTNL
ncbi:hypothetical protein ACF0H5_007384 [Mactra antiquata]